MGNEDFSSKDYARLVREAVLEYWLAHEELDSVDLTHLIEQLLEV